MFESPRVNTAADVTPLTDTEIGRFIIHQVMLPITILGFIGFLTYIGTDSSFMSSVVVIGSFLVYMICRIYVKVCLNPADDTETPA